MRVHERKRESVGLRQLPSLLHSFRLLSLALALASLFDRRSLSVGEDVGSGAGHCHHDHHGRRSESCAIVPVIMMCERRWES